MRVRVLATDGIARDLSPGELFHLDIRKGQQWWEQALAEENVFGQGVHIRTNTPLPLGYENMPVIRISLFLEKDDNEQKEQ